MELQTYTLLHNGTMYRIPFSVNEQKAHKALDWCERKERMWEWMFNNNGKVGIVVAIIVFSLTVWLGM